jgi:small subunit ribosomal protein S6
LATNRTYEVMYIVDPETADDAIGTLNETMSKLIETEGGTIIRRDDIGRKRMAYEINKKKEGYYVLFEIEGSGQEIAELERRMRVNDAIIRFVTVRVDEDRKAADKKRAKRENKANKRASFRNNKNGENNQTTEAENA